MKPIIRVQQLSKKYLLGERQATTTFREDLAAMFRAPVRLLSKDRQHKKPVDPLWALRNVSFDVMPGEVVGIIGRNGAGKSTLLKVLSRITAPTEGRVELYGRVGSLLEVGTGFHPELTGRDNIYLNGTILGMRRAEITRNFDAIVAFAEVDRFLDTPVKHYSSGMYMRLAFSVAAHLEPEILIVDEVLAVGDAGFQKKCLGKMGEVARGGRTVLFVSHNMAAVEALCTHCVWLAEGQVCQSGNTPEVIASYMAEGHALAGGACTLVSHPGRKKGSAPVMKDVMLTDARGERTSSFRTFGTLGVTVTFADFNKNSCPVLGVAIKTQLGAAVCGFNNRFISADIPVSNDGRITCWIDSLPLTAGTYLIDLYFGDEYRDCDAVEDAISFEVVHGDVFGTGKAPPSSAGPVCVPARFEFSYTEVACANSESRL